MTNTAPSQEPISCEALIISSLTQDTYEIAENGPTRRVPQVRVEENSYKPNILYLIADRMATPLLKKRNAITPVTACNAMRDADKNIHLDNQNYDFPTFAPHQLCMEHHDFFLASQHPAPSLPLKNLATKHSMPTRMWNHGIRSFLELLRHSSPPSLGLNTYQTYPENLREDWDKSNWSAHDYAPSQQSEFGKHGDCRKDVRLRALRARHRKRGPRFRKDFWFWISVLASMMITQAAALWGLPNRHDSFDIARMITWSVSHALADFYLVTVSSTTPGSPSPRWAYEILGVCIGFFLLYVGLAWLRLAAENAPQGRSWVLFPTEPSVQYICVTVIGTIILTGILGWLFSTPRGTQPVGAYIPFAATLSGAVSWRVIRWLNPNNMPVQRERDIERHETVRSNSSS